MVKYICDKCKNDIDTSYYMCNSKNEKPKDTVHICKVCMDNFLDRAIETNISEFLNGDNDD